MSRVSALIAPVFAALAACGSPPPPQPPPPPPAPAPAPAPEPPPPPREPTLAPLAVTFSTSRTAQVFHVVDALSAWGPAVRRSPYVAWAKNELALDDAERALLADHANIRRRRGWGALDQSFLVEGTIAEAAADAAKENRLSAADAERERVVLERFATRLDPLLEQQRATLDAFSAKAREELAKAALLGAKVGRFLGLEPEDRAPITVFLASDPSPMRAGGALHGGRLVVEVLAAGALDKPIVDASSTLFHELFHAMLAERRETIAMNAGKCDEAIDEPTLTEGLAYALAPGIFHAPDRDPLADLVAASRGVKLKSPPARAQRLGLALREPLARALDQGTDLRAFFTDACDAWARVANGNGSGNGNGNGNGDKSK